MGPLTPFIIMGVIGLAFLIAAANARNKNNKK